MTALLDLNLPCRQKPGKEDPDIRPKAVEAWISALPVADVGKTAQQFYAFLKGINKLQFRPQDRFACLETLRETLHFVTENLQPHFLNVNFPLPEKSYRIACASRQIYASMAIAYMIVAEDVSASSVLFRDKNLLAEALHRAISYQSRSLLTSYQIYAAFQDNHWKVLHNLYAFAEQQKLHRKKIVDTQHQYIAKTSITCEYLRILLLYLAEPYHLRQGEVGKIYINIERWLEQLALTPADNPDTLPDTAFVVDLKEDAPPFYKQFGSNISHPDAIRIIDTHKLADILEQELARPQDELSKTLICFEMQQAHLNHDIIRWLQNAWCTRKSRKFPRNKGRNQVEVSFGLNHVHQLIEKAKLSEQHPAGQSSQIGKNSLKTERLAEYEAQEVDDVNAQESDIWETVYEYRENDADSTPAEELDVPTSAAEEHNLKDNWTLVNESAGGFCLKCRTTVNTSIRVGELVGIHYPGTRNSNWTIGIVRWMKNHGDSGIEIGGQLIAPQALNVNICMAVEEGELNEEQRALWIPANKITQQPASLVCLAVPHRVGSVIRMRHNENEFTIRLSKQLGNSGMFAQFLYEVLDQNGTKDTTDAQDDHDDVWTLV